MVLNRVVVLLSLGALLGCRAEDDTGGEALLDADQDGFTEDVDCDDADSAVHPEASEVCDGVDNDCDGSIDGDDDDLEGTSFYLDSDGDGYGDEDAAIQACVAPSGYVDVSGDCDDGDAALSPESSEVCDGVDNDCDGLIDDEDDSLDTSTGSTFYLDGDLDGFGDASSPVQACLSAEGYVSDASDCDDTDASMNPAAVDTPLDGVDQNCDGSDGCLDLDCDGNTDVFVSSFFEHSQQLLMGDGASLTSEASLSACRSYDSDYSDFNGDGYIDLVVAPFECSGDVVVYGAASGFSDVNGEAFDLGWTRAVEVADLNGDGFDDAVFGANDGLYGDVFWGSAAGLSTSTQLPAFVGTDLALGDCNGDGYQDIVFCGDLENESYLYFGSAAGYSSSDYQLIEGAHGFGCHMEDLDVDGFTELILGGSSVMSDSLIYWGSSSGYSSSNRTDLTPVESESQGITTGDYNGDGYLDIFFANQSSRPSLLNYGSASGYSDSDSVSIPTSSPLASLSADLNGDGYEDLVVPSSGEDTTVFLGSAGGLSTVPDYYLAAPAGGYALSVSATDLDGDGYWELFVPDYRYATLDVDWGSASGWSSTNVEIHTGLPTSLASPLIIGSGESARSE